MHKRLYTKWHLNKNVAWSYATYLVLILPAISQESTLFFFKMKNSETITLSNVSLRPYPSWKEPPWKTQQGQCVCSQRIH